MSEIKSKLSAKLRRGGQKTKHGGYSFLSKGKLPENRKHVLRYLTAARENLILDLGPTENDLSTAQIIIVDRIVSKLGILRCIEEYTRENSVMVGQDLAPALKTSYLAYTNSVRLDLQALGIEKRQADSVSPLDHIRQFDEAKKNEGEKGK